MKRAPRRQPASEESGTEPEPPRLPSRPQLMREEAFLMSGGSRSLQGAIPSVVQHPAPQVGGLRGHGPEAGPWGWGATTVSVPSANGWVLGAESDPAEIPRHHRALRRADAGHCAQGLSRLSYHGLVTPRPAVM